MRPRPILESIVVFIILLTVTLTFLDAASHQVNTHQDSMDGVDFADTGR